MFEEHALTVCLDDFIIDNHFILRRHTHLLTILIDKNNIKIKFITQIDRMRFAEIIKTYLLKV
jgi:hypothetical protein